MLSSEETSNRNVKLELGILKVEQEIQKKRKNKEDEQKKLTLSWECFLGCGAFGGFLVFMARDNGAWWIGVVIFALLSLWGLYGIISESSKVKNLEREITRLEKRKKELKNSVR